MRALLRGIYEGAVLTAAVCLPVAYIALLVWGR
jgi:hypothetical protein